MAGWNPERAGIKVDNYYASEVDKYAIEITQKNYPDTNENYNSFDHTLQNPVQTAVVQPV